MTKSFKLKINNVDGYAGIVTIATDENGTPLDQKWRRRLKDAQFDNCVELVKDKKTRGKQNDNN